jgi:hypothetical protein
LFPEVESTNQTWPVVMTEPPPITGIPNELTPSGKFVI